MNDGESRRSRGVEVIRLTPDLQEQAVSVLADAFSAEELRYRVDGDHYVLYSVGPDLTDDGGNAAPWVSELYAPHLDIVWGETRFWH